MKKAWDELVSQPNQEIFTTENSEWWLGIGVKIERFHDGTIEVKNVMTPGDYYDDVTKCQARVFKEHGWFAGMYTVLVDTYDEKLDVYSRRVARAKSESDKKLLTEKMKATADRLVKYKSKLDEHLAISFNNQ